MSNQLRLNVVSDKLLLAGTKAKGTLKVLVLNDTTINRIKIGVIGKICIEADENGNHTAMDQAFYCSEEHIFDASDLKSEDDDQIVEFEIPLANNLPPTLVLSDAKILYNLYATMEEQFTNGNVQVVKTEAVVSVVSLVDCNTIPKAAKEKVVRTEPKRSCICIRGVESDDCLQISPRAYVPGDCIKINAVMFNAHTQPWIYVQAALVQKVKLKYEDRTMKTRRIVSETKHGSVMPQSVQVWQNEFLRIPPLPPTTYHKIVQITYKLEVTPVKQNTEGDVCKPLMSVPVVIGNLPLESALSHFNPVHYAQFHTNIPHMPQPYHEYASAEKCIQPHNRAGFVPSYITYMSERAMDNIQLQDPL